MLSTHETGCDLRIVGKPDIVASWVVACSPISDSHFPRLFHNSPWYAAHITEFIYSFYSEPDLLMAMCEYILSAGFKSALAPELTWAYEYPSSTVSMLLCNLYFENTGLARKAGENSECWIDKLRDMVTSKTQSPDAEPDYKLNVASLLLGMLLRRYGGANESIWKSCFRAQILEVIDMLTDTYDMNDIRAYALLANLLMAAGNKPAALEALAVILKPLEAIGFQAYYYPCDGPCNTQFHYYKEPLYKELYFCEDCINTCFCEDCFPIAKKGGLPYRKCSPDHKFVQVFPIPKEAMDVAARFFEGKTMEVQKGWLDKLREEWL